MLNHKTSLPLLALCCSRDTLRPTRHTRNQPPSPRGCLQCSAAPPQPLPNSRTHDMQKTARVVVLCGVTGRPRQPQPQGRLHPTLHACKYTTPSHQMYCQHLKRLLMQGTREAALRSRRGSSLITRVYNNEAALCHLPTSHNKARHIPSRQSTKPHSNTHTHTRARATQQVLDAG